MGSFFDTILRPLEYCVAWIMVAFHTVLSAVGLPQSSGVTWALSIVGLVIVIRILLIPLFVRQIKASRGMQLIQPQVKKIQEKYKGKTDQASRQAMTQETMALYKESGTNPFASCLPILLQSPIFFALFRVLNGIPKHQTIGPLNARLVEQASHASIFGAPLSDTFLHANTNSTRVVTILLIILMSATTFTTQRQLMMKNMPASALDNPFAQQQKMLLYVLPLIFAVSGVNFPIGVLIYWLVTNVWSMGQQFYVIRRMPAPGSPAEKALEERRARRREHSGGVSGLFSGRGSAGAAPAAVGGDSTGELGTGRTDGGSGQRQQPKRQPRSKRPAASGPQRPESPTATGAAAGGAGPKGPVANGPVANGTSSNGTSSSGAHGAAASGDLTHEPGSGLTDGGSGQRQQPKRQPKRKRADSGTRPSPAGPQRTPGGGAGGDPAARGSEGERPSKGR